MSKFHESDNKISVIYDMESGDGVLLGGPGILWGWHCNEDNSNNFDIDDSITRLAYVTSSVTKGDQMWFEGGLRFSTNISVDIGGTATTGIFCFIVEYSA